jgi:hypothetical protein
MLLLSSAGMTACMAVLTLYYDCQEAGRWLLVAEVPDRSRCRVAPPFILSTPGSLREPVPPVLNRRRGGTLRGGRVAVDHYTIQPLVELYGGCMAVLKAS